jgi:hypothetical protein
MLARYKQLEKVYRTILKRLFDFFFFFFECVIHDFNMRSQSSKQFLNSYRHYKK